MANTYENLRDEYAQLWKSMKFRRGWVRKSEAAAKRIHKNKERYKAVEMACGVPWFVAGLIHLMESGCNFNHHMHNGDPLSARTSHVPEGRPRTGSPPFTWLESAADAMRYTGLNKIAEWNLERICYQLERYNGFRTRTIQKMHTPYLWSGSNHYLRGKYVRDGVWSASTVSKQCGAMPVLRKLMELDDSIGEWLEHAGGAAPAPSPEPAPEPPDGQDGGAGGGTGGAAEKRFDLSELQQRLTKAPLYRDEIDGLYGRNTRRAIHGLLASLDVPAAVRWPREKLIVAGKQAICTLDNIETGEIDGILGPQTRYAVEVYEARLRGDKEPEHWRDKAEEKPPLAAPPVKAGDWPVQRDCMRFFGNVGENQTRLKLPYPLRIAWDTDTIVRSTLCHEKIHDAAERVLSRVLDHYGIEKIRALGLDLYGGCLNVRRMRGGSAWSMHAWGIAFDFDPARNRLRWNKSRAQFARPEYRKWFDLWEEEGAISLGRARDFDWMHVQFARL